MLFQEHFSAAKEFAMIAAEAYLSEPDVRLSDRRLKLVPHKEDECRHNWHCTNYELVIGGRPLKIAALGKLEIPVSFCSKTEMA